MDEKWIEISGKVEIKGRLIAAEGASSSSGLQTKMATANLANLRAVCETFDIDQCDTSNIERKWKSWLENFEICTEYEGVEDPKKRRAALLAVAGPQIRELLGTLEEEEAKTYDTVKKVFNDYFQGKKNLTAERYKFLCMKPESESETHDTWITRLKKVGADCEWEQMNLKEAIKLAVTLHTKSPKLQAEIIAQDLDYNKMVEKARAIELTKKELGNLKQGENQFKIDSLGRSGGNPRGGPLKYNWDANRGRGQFRRSQQANWRDSRNTKEGQQTSGNNSKSVPFQTNPNSDSPTVCGNCGHRVTDRHECPAKQSYCLACNGKGHYARVCRRRNRDLNQLEQQPEEGEEYDFDSLEFSLDKVDIEAPEGLNKVSSKRYPDTNTNLKIHGHKVCMKIDSGAEATVISSEVFDQIQQTASRRGNPIQLKNTSARLRPYNSPPIAIRGAFQAEVASRRSNIVTTIFVTQGQGNKSLLSKYAAFDLGILQITADELCSSLDKPKKLVPDIKHLEYPQIARHLTAGQRLSTKYASLQAGRDAPQQVDELLDMFADRFVGIGCHKFRQVRLDIDEAVKPRVQARRKIPFAKRVKLDDILEELEGEDIIEEVSGPTEWISNLVLMPKTDHKLRMNIDMTMANVAIKRTRHVIPTIEELKYSLNGAEVFSKLDMRQGYMQFQLHPDSRHMTVFYTHQGLRRMKRLNFGTN